MLNLEFGSLVLDNGDVVCKTLTALVVFADLMVEIWSLWCTDQKVWKSAFGWRRSGDISALRSSIVVVRVIFGNPWENSRS